MTKESLIQKLQVSGVLRSQRIKDALEHVDRIDFVPKALVDEAYEDYPLSIGEGQTISQPTTVVFMLELLEVKEGDQILEIGAGSGWVTALLCYLTGEKGFVSAYEINQKVGLFGQANLIDVNFQNYRYEIANASEHWQENAPFDKITAAAAFLEIPPDITKLLNPEGIAVIPTQEFDIKKLHKTKSEEVKEESYYGFTFVPFR